MKVRIERDETLRKKVDHLMSTIQMSQEQINPSFTPLSQVNPESCQISRAGPLAFMNPIRIFFEGHYDQWAFLHHITWHELGWSGMVKHPLWQWMSGIFLFPALYGRVEDMALKNRPSKTAKRDFLRLCFSPPIRPELPTEQETTLKDCKCLR
jgi:hypothetical protein